MPTFRTENNLLAMFEAQAAAADLPLEVIEEVQGLLLEAQASVGANVSPRGLLESLKIRLHRLIGLARRRTVGGEG